jgi:hypothetical protein
MMKSARGVPIVTTTEKVNVDKGFSPRRSDRFVIVEP